MDRRLDRGVRPLLAVVVAAALAVTGCSEDAEPGAASSDTTPTSPSPSPSTSSGPTGIPPGEQIVFERVVGGEEDRDLYLVSPDGGEAALLRSPGDSPRWSPDGTGLAFLACLDPPDCGTALAVLDRSTGKVGWAPSPDPDLEPHCRAWEPDGRRLACEVLSETPRRTGVYTVRFPGGKDPVQLTSNPGGEDAPLAFSPKGDLLLFNRTPASGAGAAMFVVPVRGGRPQRITEPGIAEGDAAAWTPDGRTIVFAGGGGTVYRVSPDGRDLEAIALRDPSGSAVTNAFDVGLSPDGRSLVFSRGGPDPGIYRAPLAGGEVQRLTTGDDHHASWGAGVS